LSTKPKIYLLFLFSLKIQFDIPKKNAIMMVRRISRIQFPKKGNNGMLHQLGGEFKKFINRGNVVDMAVGVIVGSAFTAIVTSISNNILKPIINWLLSLILKADSLHEIYTFLKTVYLPDENGNPTAEIDLKQSIYIDWGSFLNAVINFFLIAAVLFSIVKIINRFRKDQKRLSQKISDLILDRGERRELKEAGISVGDKEAVKAYFAEKKKKEAEKKAAEAEEAKRKDREKNPTTEDLLKLILAELKSGREGEKPPAP